MNINYLLLLIDFSSGDVSAFDFFGLIGGNLNLSAY